jgi:hypothetical protein
MLAAAGIARPQDLGPQHLVRRISQSEIRLYSQIHTYLKPGELLEQGEQHPFYGLSWKLADANSFTAEKGYTAFNELELR